MTPSGEAAAPAAGGWITRLSGSRRFQAWAARVPGLRRLVRAEGAAIFDIMQGFVRSQVLAALVEFRLLSMLEEKPAPVEALARRCGVPAERLRVLLQAGAAMGLLRRRGDLYGLSLRGAAFLAVPGLDEMVRHHRVLYGDLADPAAFFRGETEPELARFWPYVLGGGDAASATRYSRLMADSQALVAEETLAQVSLAGIGHLMDVGGGTGAFLRAVRACAPDMRLTLFDLPDVVAQAVLPAGASREAGSFRDGVPDVGADAISLVRVLYDHADDTVIRLLGAVHGALPPGGRLILSEPMSGGQRPDPQVDVYFSVYTLAMQTGRTRSVAEITAMLRETGFENVQSHRANRPFVTSIITARRGAARKSAVSRDKTVQLC